MILKTKPGLAEFKLEALCCLLIVLLGIIVFGNHLKNSFQFDSVAYVVNNQNLKNPEEMLTLDYWERGLFSRSLVQMSLAMNAILGQMQPFGYHLFNLTFHIFNALLIFFVTRKTCLDLSPEFKPLSREPVRVLSLFTALLFLCHPLQTESVVYIMSRSEVLSATFYLGGFYLFQTCVESGPKISPAIKYIGLPPLLGMIFLTGFSVKQTLITLPAVLLLFSLCRADAQSGPIKFLKQWRWVLTGIVLLAGILLLRKLLADETLLIGPSNPDEMVGRKNYLLSQPSVLIFYYLKLLLFPFNLNIDPVLPVVADLFSSRFLVPLAGIGAMLYLTARAKKTRIYFFCVAWFFILISPSSSIVTLHDLAAEHRTYLAAYGFYLLFVLGVFQLRVKKRAVFFVLVILTCSLGLMTVKRNLVWRSEVTLWEDTRKKSPAIVRPLINLGRAYGEAGETKRAIYYYEKSLALAPGVFASNYNLGDLYLTKGRVDTALQLFHRAEKIDPQVPEVQAKLGEIYLDKKQFELALGYFKKAVELNPKYPSVLRNLGILNYFHLGRPQEGIAYFSRSLTLDPDQPEAEKIRQIVTRAHRQP
jgi:tetratricopeptide (TPR) repeat protein